MDSEAGGTALTGRADALRAEAPRELPTMGLRIRVLRASFWALLQSSAPKFVSFIALMIMTRFLSPAEIGIAAAIGALLALAELICEQGLGDTLVQRHQVSRADQNLVFCTIVGTALVVAATMSLGADFIAGLLRAPELDTYIHIAALYLPLAGLGVVQQSIYRRKLEYRWIGVRSAIAAVISAIFAVATAWAGGGAWALIVQITMFGALSSTLLWVGRPFIPTLDIKGADVAGIFRYSSMLAGSKLVEFAASRSIEFIILGRLGAAALGLYFLGAKLAQTALQLISPPLVDVAHAVFSRAATDREQARELYLRGMLACGLIAVPLMIMLSVLSSEVVRVLYGNAAANAAPVLAYLSLLGALSCIQYVNLSFLNASGRPSISFLFTLARAVAINFLLLFSHADDVSEIVLIFALTETFLFPVSIWLATRLAGISIARWIGRMWPVLAAAAAMYVAMITLGTEAVADLHPVARILILGPAGALVFAGVAWMLDGRRILQFVRGTTTRLQ
jgi:O-antigen/teichoic acid export membrane protein